MLQNISMDFLLDLFLVCLLLATIGYCAMLNRKLSSLRNAHQELRQLSEEFDKAIVKSKLGVDELKKVAQQTGTQMKADIGQANELIEELQLINASSARIADRIQKNVEVSAQGKFADDYDNDPAGLYVDENKEERQPSEKTETFRTDAEKELFDMLTKAT